MQCGRPLPRQPSSERAAGPDWQSPINEALKRTRIQDEAEATHRDLQIGANAVLRRREKKEPLFVAERLGLARTRIS